MSATAQAHVRLDKSSAAMLSVIKDYWILTKPEVNFLVVASAFTGLWVAKQGPVAPGLVLHTLIGTVLVASGTATLNQFMEVRGDALMRRTGYRPLPSGRMAPWKALTFGLVISIIGTLQLWLKVNALSSALAVSTLLSYLLIYTPLKKKTAWCTFLGAFPGAVPPLIGWAAVRGSLAPQAWLLFSVVFLWQFPHFLAIAWLYRDDYRRAGLKMLPGSDSTGRFTAYEIVVLTVALIATTLLPVLLHYEGLIYFAVALTAGAFFLRESCRMLSQRSLTTARRLLHASVLYLPLLFAVMVFDKLNW
jgi:protoheme IX farnesyltransferase